MKLVGRQFRGFQSAESGTRRRGRPRGQAEALFSSGPAAITRCASSPCPRHSFTCQNMLIFQMHTINSCFLTCACSNAARVHLRFTFYHTSSRHRISDWIERCRERAMRTATMNGGMTKWPIAHLENVGKGICHAFRLCHQSRHWAADPSLLVTAEPKPLRFPWSGTLSADASVACSEDEERRADHPR